MRGNEWKRDSHIGLSLVLDLFSLVLILFSLVSISFSLVLIIQSSFSIIQNSFNLSKRKKKVLTRWCIQGVFNSLEYRIQNNIKRREQVQCYKNLKRKKSKKKFMLLLFLLFNARFSLSIFHDPPDFIKILTQIIYIKYI